MSKKQKICILSLAIIVFVGGLFIKQKKQTDWENNPEKVIENYFKFQNNHDIDKLSDCYLKQPYNGSYKLSKEELNNIENTKVIKIELLKNENTYKGDLDIYNQLNPNNLIEKEDIKIYSVSYYIRFKDDSNTPIKNGEDQVFFTIVKDKNSDWKIFTIEM
ncbi:DUF4829 domain-containing protein [Romboutsia maritimum]|uniref:DUF4829 domain-containing protein n=1 Tax=Romboutsia maritimum TaxID=2020948 RepID=A0A371IRW1_9FIRM|nr:DUF4829 domain-containing protein [Romboutsia maritimum]RDY23211.1 DUF4829 domain-containing protein [Romboutsia maritimum]